MDKMAEELSSIKTVGIDMLIWNHYTRLIVDELLKYAQVIKMRADRLKKVFKRIIFGENIDPKMISTSYIERLNLTCRQDNNRISRKL